MPNGRSKLYLLLALLTMAAALTLNTVLRHEALADGQDYDVDGFYHVTMADLFPGACVARQFPWTQLSLWREHFHDKELGFHALLAGLRHAGRWLGASSVAPFHFLQGALLLLLLTVLTLVPLLAFRVQSAFLIPPLLLVVSPLLVLRVNMVRPHVLSIALFALTLLLLLWTSQPRTRCWLVAGVSFLYTWCYSSPHLVLVPVAAFALAHAYAAWRDGVREPGFRGQGSGLGGSSSSVPCPEPQVPSPESGGSATRAALRHGAMLLLCAVAGLVAGYTLHPQFPNTFTGWYAQGVLVGRQILGEDFGVGLGVELLRPSRQTLVENWPLFALLLVNAALLVKTQWRSRAGVAFFLAQAVMTAGFLLFSERCVEYAAPAGVLCLVFLWEELTQCGGLWTMDHGPWTAKPDASAVPAAVSPEPQPVLAPGAVVPAVGWSPARRCLGVLVAVLLFAAAVPGMRSALQDGRFRACTLFGAWARENLPPGTYVGQIRWGEFPRLFYAAPHLRYAMAMDPMFTYIVYPDTIRRLEAFRQVKQALEPKELRAILGTSLVFVGNYDPVPARHLAGSGCKSLYSGPDGQLFLLP